MSEARSRRVAQKGGPRDAREDASRDAREGLAHEANQRRPRVALTTSWVEMEEGVRRPYAVLYQVYVDALEAAGIAVVPLTPAHSKASIDALLDACDGLVLGGGGDIDPARFGEAPHPTSDWVMPARDALEWAVLDAAVDRGMPVLGICRGYQVLNVYSGGTLYQDLPSQRPSAVTHHQGQAWGNRTHEVAIQTGSRLHAAIGLERHLTNTFHHQGVRDVPSALEPIAWSDDGLVEGIQARDGQWFVGVQWHPERFPERVDPEDPDDPDRRLFASFAAEAAAWGGAR